MNRLDKIEILLIKILMALACGLAFFSMLLPTPAGRKSWSCSTTLRGNIPRRRLAIDGALLRPESGRRDGRGQWTCFHGREYLSADGVRAEKLLSLHRIAGFSLFCVEFL